MRHIRRWITLATLLALIGAPLRAQQGGEAMSSRGPQFLLAPRGNGRPVVADVGRTAVLMRRISVDLRGMTLETALGTISKASGLDLIYGDGIVRLTDRVHLKADEITVAAVLTAVLLDTDVDVMLSPGNRATLVKRSAVRVAAHETGSIVGRVTDGKTGDRLTGVEVYLDGTRWRTVTGENGAYHLTDVAVGSYTMVIRRVGYARQTRPVAVVDSKEIVLDVALEPVATQLDELVTTVTGEQRARELGHVVGRINADSLVKEAPVSSLAELLNGRVPGLQVFTSSGIVGGNVSLRIRSLNSVFVGQNGPIVLVDGVRISTAKNGGPAGVEATSRLNDLNPNDIDAIEVVKGPSAATLYGTDAANGVVLITTKRGRPGPTRWEGYARAARGSIPSQHFEDGWFAWGDSYGFPNNPYNNCTIRLLVRNQCTHQDSIVRIANPLNDAASTIFANKPSWQYGLSASGGKQDFRYHFSGDLSQATGPITMPRETIERLKAQRGVSELPEDQLTPNALDRLNLSGQITNGLGAKADLQISGGYVNSATRTINNDVYRGTASPYASPSNPFGSEGDPGYVFSQTSTENLDRVIGSASGQWRVTSWLQGRGTVGLDLGDIGRYTLSRPGEGTPEGSVSDFRTRQLGVTGDLGLTAMARRGRLSFRTSGGAQYQRQLLNSLSAYGYGLPPGGESVGQAASMAVYQSYDERVTLGSYLEETVGLNDRLFVTGAIRVDGASTFGSNYDAVAYPKASVSWIASEEPFMPRIPGLDELRFRYAFGTSGQSASPDMTLPSYGSNQVLLDGAMVNTLELSLLGNPNLKPEQVREHEIGLDAAGFDGRVRVGLTWFKRRTVDPIVTRDLAPGFGFIFANLGLITGHGFEAEFSLRPIETRALSWQLTLNHSLRRAIVVDLGTLSEVRSEWGGYVESYPLGGRFSPKILSYDDTNGDGLLGPSEVQVSDLVYQGESTPASTQTLATSVGLFDQRVRISALFERRAGYTQINQLLADQCRGPCRSAVDPATPLAQQAEVVAIQNYFYVPIESGTFTRFRELSASFELPPNLARGMRVTSARLSLTARNVALWSSFSGPDPESASLNGYSGGSAVGIPQGRAYVVRVDLGL